MEEIYKLKEIGFFDMKIDDQIQFLREHRFFDYDNQKKIEILEKLGLFYIDINNDPPNIPLEPEKIDYLKENSENKKKNQISNNWKESFVNNSIKKKKLVIDKVNGIDNVLEVKTGAIITCNHFNPFDTFSIEKSLKEMGVNKRIYKVIREGNYTNFPGNFGLYFKYDNTLPLSSIPETMEKFERAVEEILKRGDLIIVCPEQSMWLNYKKPKPFKYGAFKWATKNNVPIIPTFITMKDSDILGEDGSSIQRYTINIGEAIYPRKDFSDRTNICRMRDEDYSYCRRVYEDTYQNSLHYTTIPHDYLKEYIKSTQGFYTMIEESER